MTPQEISNKIINVWSDAMEQRTNKQHVEDALESVTPYLGYIPAMKRVAEAEYAIACAEGIGSSGGPERVKLKLAEGYAAEQKGNLEEIKSLEKSLLT